MNAKSLLAGCLPVVFAALPATAQLPAHVRGGDGRGAMGHVFVTGIRDGKLHFKPDPKLPGSAAVPLGQIAAIEFEIPAEFVAASALRRTGRTQEALAIYQKLAGPYLPYAVVQKSNVLPLFLEVGDTRRLIGPPQAAIAFLQEHFPDTRSMPDAARVIHAACLLDAGQMAEAAGTIGPAGELETGDPYFLLQQAVLARLAAADGDPVAAADLAARGLALGSANSPHYPELLEVAADIYGAIAKSPDAQEDTRAAKGQQQILEQLTRFHPDYTRRNPAAPIETQPTDSQP
jgi:tetratricopeptide (TPR) repeat protein